MAPASSIVIRPAAQGDDAVLRRLAQLDSAAALHGDVLVAEVDGRIVAALDARSGARVADPFTHTADVLALLQLRGRGDRPGTRPPTRRSRRGMPHVRLRPRAV